MSHTHTHTHWHVDQDNMSPEGSGPLNNPFIGLMNDGEHRAGGFRRRGPTRRRVGKNPTQPARIGRGATTSLCGVREKIKPELGEPSRETKGRENATKRTRQKKRNQRKTSRWKDAKRSEGPATFFSRLGLLLVVHLLFSLRQCVCVCVCVCVGVSFEFL